MPPIMGNQIDWPPYCKMPQDAVYWNPVAPDNAYGKPAFGLPSQIKCRWQDKSTLFIDREGREQVSRAIVYVNTDTLYKGALWLGRLTDLVDADDPFKNPGAWEIRKFDKSPTLDGTKVVRKAIL